MRTLFPAIIICFAALLWATDGEDKFTFGSYGRVQPSTDLEGGSGRHTNIVSHGSRLEQPTYLELDLVYDFASKPDETDFHLVTTLAFGESLFHDTGAFALVSAVRNLFVRAERVGYKPLLVWAGSRMYRGDDIYLLDLWPLDDLNIYGAGMGLRYPDTEVDVHFGLNRLETDWQVQKREVPSETFGTETVEWMDRQRIIAGAKATQYFLRKADSPFALKMKLFAEMQSIGSGVRVSEHSVNAATEEDRIAYPADLGWSVGAQFGAIGFLPNSFAHLFFKYSGGLAAYGTLAEPFGYDIDRKTTKAQEIMTALAGNVEFWRMSIMAGSYARYFTDADPNKYDNDDGWDFILAVRTHIRIYESLALGMEVSHQLRKPNGIASDTAEESLPMITKLSLFPVVSKGDLSYGRPQVRLVYTVSFVNGDARASFPEGDKRRDRAIQHFLGIGAEWWFNTEYR